MKPVITIKSLTSAIYTTFFAILLAAMLSVCAGCATGGPPYPQPKVQEKCVPIVIDGRHRGCIRASRLPCLLRGECT